MASSGGKSLAVLIKKAMAKIPASLDTKKSIDEYYKTTMKEIVMKMKAEEKAMKAALKAKEKVVEKARKAVAKPKAVKDSNAVKKPRKLYRGGMTEEDKKRELEIINNLFTKFISYNDRIMKEGSKYINTDSGSYRSDIKGICVELNKLFDEEISISDDDITSSLGSKTYVQNIYDFLDDRVKYILQHIIYDDYYSEYDKYVGRYNAKYNNNTYWDKTM